MFCILLLSLKYILGLVFKKTNVSLVIDLQFLFHDAHALQLKEALWVSPIRSIWIGFTSSCSSSYHGNYIQQMSFLVDSFLYMLLLAGQQVIIVRDFEIKLHDSQAQRWTWTLEIINQSWENGMSCSGIKEDDLDL